MLANSNQAGQYQADRTEKTGTFTDGSYRLPITQGNSRPISNCRGEGKEALKGVHSGSASSQIVSKAR